jgi:RNA polymerase-binding transcription factor DksA
MKENLIPERFLGDERNNEGSISEPFKGQFLASLSNQIQKAQDLASSLQNDSQEPQGDDADIASYRNEMSTTNVRINNLKHFIETCKKISNEVLAGTFTGRCYVTGKKIPEKRLLVAPSNLSREGKEAIEKMKKKNLYTEWVKRGKFLNDQGLDFLEIKKD